MKTYIVLILVLFSLKSVAQIDYKRQLDSLTTVHKVCVIENSIRNHRIKLDHLKKQKQSLNAQLQEIQGFKLGRTDAEKEEQLAEINPLIEANATTLTAAGVQLTTLINELVMANEDVKDLQIK
ncbi:hypothetical protein [Gelidibacter mesophilus]|uniref:hypothetical protein n=1 Tax=Gelidibacter mesophilus TaxID=169050 RepID=UPI0004088179|nr:hypothetical protein [Gelidibacter mesophilus]